MKNRGEGSVHFMTIVIVAFVVVSDMGYGYPGHGRLDGLFVFRTGAEDLVLNGWVSCLQAGCRRVAMDS